MLAHTAVCNSNGFIYMLLVRKHVCSYPEDSWHEDCRGAMCEVLEFILTVHVSVCHSVCFVACSGMVLCVRVCGPKKQRAAAGCSLWSGYRSGCVPSLLCRLHVCLSLSLSPNSFCLSRFLLPLSAPLSYFLVTEALGLRHPSLFLWHHYRPLPLSLLSVFLPFPLSLSLFLSSYHLLTGSSPAAGPHSLQEAGGHVTLFPDLFLPQTLLEKGPIWRPPSIPLVVLLWAIAHFIPGLPPVRCFMRKSFKHEHALSSDHKLILSSNKDAHSICGQMRTMLPARSWTITYN